MTRYLAGPVIDVMVGADKERLLVHVEALLSCDSPSLRKLVSGDWKESRERVIDWSQVDAATIKRFLTFLYTRDYTAPDPEPIRADHTSDLKTPIKYDINQPDDPIEANAVPEVDTDAMEPKEEWSQEETAFIQNAIIDSFRPRPLTPISKCLDVGLPSERIRTAAGRLEECSFAYSTHRYGVTLLAHARIYTFAQCHFVAELQEFSLQRLTQALKYIDCTQAHAVSDVTPLMDYVYSNTLNHESREEPIRKLVSQFAAIHYTDLMTGEFEEVFSRGGDFTLDVARKISRRLAVSGVSTKTLEEELDDLEDQIRKLKLVAEDREAQLTRLRLELAEWQNGERGVSKRGKKKTYF
jgi:hypothetical protein